MDTVRVGVGTLLIKDELIFLSKRSGSHGEGTWGSSGGHLEFGETLEDCAKREAYEEFVIQLRDLRFLCVSNVIDYGSHYLDVEFLSELDDNQVPSNQEHNKFDIFGWFPFENLPEPLFKPVEYAIKSFLTGSYYWDKHI